MEMTTDSGQKNRIWSLMIAETHTSPSAHQSIFDPKLIEFVNHFLALSLGRF